MPTVLLKSFEGSAKLPTLQFAEKRAQQLLKKRPALLQLGFLSRPPLLRSTRTARCFPSSALGLSPERRHHPWLASLTSQPAYLSHNRL